MRRLPRRVPQEGRALIWWLAAALAQDPARGAILAEAAGCASCHTADGGTPYAGGHAVNTRFGTFYGPNLTNLDGWTLEDFDRAIDKGRPPRGRAFYPSFPYTSYTLLTDADVADLWAYLTSLPPDDRPNQPHEIKGRYRGRFLLGLWRLVSFRDRDFVPTGDPVLDRGAYLGTAVAHCGECHSPRDGLGRVKKRHALEGFDGEPEPAPDLVHLAWSVDDLETLFDYGLTPSGDVVGGNMAHVIDGTAALSPEDRHALAVWVKSFAR